MHEGPLLWKINKDKRIGERTQQHNTQQHSVHALTCVQTNRLCIIHINTQTQFFYTSVNLSELYTLLLEDILVLLQKQDERLVLKFHGKNPTAAADTKNIFSPVIKLNTVLVRPVATSTNDTHLSLSLYLMSLRPRQ